MASGLAAALLVVVGGTSLLTGGHSSEVPTITAPAGPVKVRPANPGGMRVGPSQNPSLSASTGAPGADTLAPPPETPDPQALTASLAPPKPASTASVAVTTAPASTSPSLHFALPLPPTPPAWLVASALPPPPPPPAAPAASTASQGTGGVQVQLAALSSAADARVEWHRLEARIPSVLRGYAPDIMKVESGGRVFWRLRTGHFTSIAAATDFCQAVLAAHGRCTIATW